MISTKKKPKGELIERPYTPISTIEQLVLSSIFIKILIFLKGSFDLLFKVYRKGSNPKFPEGGPMTQYLESLRVLKNEFFPLLLIR